MPPELKDALAHAAHDNGRSLNAEVVLRLERSFQAKTGLVVDHPAAVKRGTIAQEHARYTAQRQLSELEEAFLQVLKKLPPEKQLALLSLFK